MRNVFLFTLKTSTIQKTSSYQEIPTPRFVDIILAGGEQADEAMFFLLHHRLKRTGQGDRHLSHACFEE